MTVFVSPRTIDDAVAVMANDRYQILAGGTDIYPAYVGKPITKPLLDVVGISHLKEISCTQDYWRIGGAVSWSDIIKADLPSQFDGLKLAAREVGAKQIQNVGTIGGNLCNASPAADGVPPLLTLDAKIELTSKIGNRCLALEDFILGNRKTEIKQDELLSAILIPRAMDGAVSHFQKLGSRSYLVISIVMVACMLDIDPAGIIKSARVSVGACSEVAKRLHALEEVLVGVNAKDAFTHIKDDHFSGLSPIDDVRATAAYRMKAARELVQRSVIACGVAKL